MVLKAAVCYRRQHMEEQPAGGMQRQGGWGTWWPPSLPAPELHSMFFCCPEHSPDQIYQIKCVFYCKLILHSAFIVQCYVLPMCRKPKSMQSLPLRNYTLWIRYSWRSERRNKRGELRSKMVLLFGPFDFIYGFGQFFMDGINLSTL